MTLHCCIPRRRRASAPPPRTRSSASCDLSATETGSSSKRLHGQRRVRKCRCVDRPSQVLPSGHYVDLGCDVRADIPRRTLNILDYESPSGVCPPNYRTSDPIWRTSASESKVEHQRNTVKRVGNVQDENSFVFYRQKKPSKTLFSLFNRGRAWKAGFRRHHR